eukprot:15454608-Alexandrium_andersonii.AAC.1
MVIGAEVGRRDIVVDPAGLRYVQQGGPRGRPWDAGGASQAIYKYYDIIREGFPVGLQHRLTEVAKAALHMYTVLGTSFWVVH